MITRNLQSELKLALQNMPVVALLGPRQVGKTTLATGVVDFFTKPSLYLDLESDTDYNKLQDAEAFFKRYDNTLIIIDEVQRKPDLFRILRGIVDQRKRNGERAGHFLLLGSASKDLLQHSSETLAGRIRYLELTPFTANELIPNKHFYNMEKLWIQGGFPDSYLAETENESWKWRNDFIGTYMQRDLPLMGVKV